MQTIATTSNNHKRPYNIAYVENTPGVYETDIHGIFISFGKGVVLRIMPDKTAVLFKNEGHLLIGIDFTFSGQKVSLECYN